MLRSNTNTCQIDYRERREARSELDFRVLDLGACRAVNYGRKEVSLKEIDAACKEYWGFVNAAIDTKALNSEKGRRGFYDDLKTKGALLCNTLMESSTRQRLWRLAESSEVLVMITGLLQVPWEALYNPEAKGGRFLGDCCVISRWPENTGENSIEPSGEVPNFTKSRLFCVDPILADEKLDELTITHVLEADGEEVYRTSLKNELMQKVKEVRLVHWICEHAEQGLRLDANVFYTVADSIAHKFPRGSILVLTSCRSGGSSADKSVAEGICTSSECTVIAPSSVVAAKTGITFARRINRVVGESTSEMSIADVWSKVRGIDVEPSGIERPVTEELCLSLWYGIYGNATAIVRK